MARLEADPLAELPLERDGRSRARALEEGDNAVGLGSANHPFAVLADADITPRGAQAVKENDDEPVPEPSLGIPLKRDDRTR